MRRFLLLLLITWPMLAHAGWTNLNTGINDDLTGVVFWGNVGFVSGHKGIYYTTTGGNGPASWTRYNIVGNTADSLVYNYTRFTHAYSNPASTPSQVYFCGTDTVNGTAIILQINYPALSYSIRYQGPAGSALNRIGYCSINSNYYAVGDNGLIVRFNTSTYSVVSAPFTHPLSAIHFAGNSYFLGTNGYHIYGTTAGTTFTYNVQAAPGKNFRDVVVSSGSNGYRVGNGYYRSQGANITESTDYDFGPLNARCILERNSMHFVGTDHGIFRSTGSYNFLEWQPSSGQYSIHALWNLQSATNTFYACGDNGVVLYTTDQGGPVKPYVYISTGNTACINTSKLLAAFTGSSSSCQRFIDGILQPGSSCGSFSYTFTTSGPHTLQWVGSNGSGNYDTAFQTITVYDYPQGTRPYTISDTLLCHETPITITLDSSELNTFYLLRKVGQVPSSGSSGNGTGGQISFMTNPLSPGQYYLQASSLAGGCAVNFTDTFTIQVEYTTARFHTSLINAEPGETVHFYQNCRDAQYYQWNFGNGAQTLTSIQPVVPNSFSATGPTQVNLVCWSNNGCYDSIQGPGPFIYTPPAIEDSCWTLVNYGLELATTPNTAANIRHLQPGKYGIMTCGSYYDSLVIISNAGASATFPQNDSGSVFSYYNDQGVLKWQIRSIGSYMYQSVQAEDGSIYISGLGSKGLFDNTGDSIAYVYNSPVGDNHTNFILKVDSAGRKIWLMATDVFQPQKLALDKSGNLIVGAWRFYIGPGTSVYLNGIPVFNFQDVGSPPCENYLFKISPSGQILWNSGLSFNDNDDELITDIGTDADNNIYMTGIYSSVVNFYTPLGTLAASIPIIPGYLDDLLFLVKYDSTGMFQWYNRSYCSAGSAYGVVPTSMVTDSLGNCYITGRNGIYANVNLSHVFENADHSLTNANIGEYFVARVDSSGMCRWIQGVAHSHIGSGDKIMYADGEVKVAGWIRNNIASNITSTFTSANGIFKVLTLQEGDYFIAVYDTLGNLLRIVRNSLDPPLLTPFTFEFGGFFKKPNGAHYLSRAFNYNFSYVGGYHNFGDELPVLTEADGSITRFVESCGYTYYSCVQQVPLTMTGCDSIITPTGNIVHTSGLVLDTLGGGFACDTFYLINATILPIPRTTLNETTCDSLYLNGTYYSTSGTHYQYLPAANGCDSVITLHLQNNHPIYNVIIIDGDHYGVDPPFGDHQWLDCLNGMSPIPGETNAPFFPTQSGVYAVVVTRFGCSDTSDCIPITLSGLPNTEDDLFIQVYPNPTQGVAMVYTTMKMDRVQIAIRDMYGRTVYTQSELNGNYFPLDLSALAAGVYLVELSSETGRYQVRLIKE